MQVFVRQAVTPKALLQWAHQDLCAQVHDSQRIGKAPPAAAGAATLANAVQSAFPGNRIYFWTSLAKLKLVRLGSWVCAMREQQVKRGTPPVTGVG